MNTVMDVAKYIYNRYKTEYEQKIDEMKLHKMLYFAQRESLIQTDKPLFKECFSGWKFGPVMQKIRKAYKNGQFDDFSYDYTKNHQVFFLNIMDKIFKDYAEKESWSLSRLTHGELSWQKSRKDIDEGENGNSKIRLKDIRKDAQRIKKRRELLTSLKLINE